MRPERQKGFSLVAAIFLLVVLALMGALIASVSGMQQAGGQLDLLGVRAYHSARAGMEWAAHQIVDPNNTLNQGPPPSCSPINMPVCPASPTNLSSLGGSLTGFTVTVECTQQPAWDTTESNRNVRVFQVVATACNQPAGGACPGVPANGYVERRLEATFSKCKDSTATAPRCSCG
jgi:MSHA biogenesis protein MshP